MWELLAIVLVVGVVIWAMSRSGELFYISIRDGRLLVVRGHVPQALLNDFAAALKSPPLRRGSIKAVRGAHGGNLITRGIDELREQRLRNIYRIYPVSNYRAPPGRRGDRTLGQLLGIAWLAWLLNRHE